jgi:hypothetical protein
VPIIAHGGEMVLNQSQIKELFSLLSNKSGGGYTNNNNLGAVNIYQNMDVDTLVSKLSFNYRTRSDIL